MTETNSNNEKKGLNINTLLNVITLVGLIVLYVLFFTNKTGTGDKPGIDSSAIEKLDENIPNIAYVNSDSIIENYTLYEEMQDDLEKKQEEMQSQLQWKRSQFEKDARAFYEKLNSGGFLTRQSAEEEQQKLAKREQEIMEMSQKLSNDLANIEIKWHSKILDTITSFLKRYNTKKNYDYILGYSKGGGILLANDSLDLTEEILIKLNTQYAKSKETGEEESKDGE